MCVALDLVTPEPFLWSAVEDLLALVELFLAAVARVLAGAFWVAGVEVWALHPRMVIPIPSAQHKIFRMRVFFQFIRGPTKRAAGFPWGGPPGRRVKPLI